MTGAPGDPAPDGPAPPTPEATPEAAPAPTAAPLAEQPAPHDRWAHRRGEPRVFAFLWTVFLFAATAATFLSALSSGYATPEVMRPATRALMAVTLCGVALLWPMVRLSQAADRHPVAGCAQDLIVVLIPAQAVIWPQWFGWLGRWPVSVVGAVSILCCCWALLAGGLLALAQTGHTAAALRESAPRWPAGRWMGVFLVLSLGGVIPMLAHAATVGLGEAQEPSRLSWMLSPVSAVYEITRDRAWTGASAAVTGRHWIALACTAGAAVPLWLAALIRARGLTEAVGLH